MNLIMSFALRPPSRCPVTKKERPSAEQPKTSIQCSAETERSAVWQNESLDELPVIVNQRSMPPFTKS